MSHIRSSNWSYRIELGAQDKIRAKFFIAEETKYFNALVTGLAGPLRTMPDTLASLTGRWEELFGLAASHGINPLDTAAKKWPKAYARYADLIEGENDAKKSLLFGIATSPATLSHIVRKNMAIEILRHTREQSAAISNPLVGEGSVYHFAVEVLSPFEDGQKRHVQVPVNALKRETAEDGHISIQLPYLGKSLTLPIPPVEWNMAVLREDRDGSHTLELSREISSYNVKRVDAAGPRTPRRRKSDQRSASTSSNRTRGHSTSSVRQRS